MNSQPTCHVSFHRVTLFTFLGAALLCGSAPRLRAEEAASAFDRSARILKFGAVHGESAPTKVDAVHALGLLGDPRAIPLLVEHLENEETDHLRLEIVRALGWIGGDAVVPALEKSLKDKYPYVRKQSAVALKKITGKDYAFDKTGLPDPAKLREILDKAREEQKK